MESAQTLIIHTSGLNWGTVGAILISALIGGFIALISVAKHRIIAKKKAAEEYILILWSARVQDAEKKFREYLQFDKLLKVFEAKTAIEIDDKVLIQHF